MLLVGLVWWAASELVSAPEQPFDQPVRLEARVIRAPIPTHPRPDTIDFAVPAVARWCRGGGGRALLLEAATESGNGLLALVRWPPRPDSLAAGPSPPPPGSFPMITQGDSVTPRGARVSVRYMIGDVAHGFPLDSGALELDSTAGARALTGRVAGTSLEATLRVSLAARFRGVPFVADSGRCGFQP